MLNNGNLISGLGRYRLVFETPYLSNQKLAGQALSAYKIFEVVPGAVIAGKVNGREKVTITLNLITSNGRKFTFADQKFADQYGNFSFRVPYTTEINQGGTVPLGNYSIVVQGKRILEVPASPQQIENAKTIDLGSI